MWPFTTWLVTNLTVTGFWILLFVFNRTTVIGKHHVGTRRNTLLLSHHQSMIDSFLVGLGVFYPASWFHSHLLPWNPAAVENFYRNPFMAWLADNWRCIPVREGRRDPQALRDMIQVLPHGVMVVFPQGTRSRDGSVGSGRAGAGLLVLSARPRVIPVAVEGMQDVLPIGRYLPRIGKRIYVSYGAPVEYDDLLSENPTREATQAVMERVMDRIREQHLELRRLREARAGRGQSPDPAP